MPRCRNQYQAITDILLTACKLKGYLKLEYEFSNYELCEQESKQKKSEAL